LPYLASSVYSVSSAVLQTPSAPNWLWGDWLGTIVDVDGGLYMVLAEGPICCAGTIGLLIVIMGLVLAISGTGQEQEYEAEDEYSKGTNLEGQDQW
jgi:hypothetical protein